MDDIFGRGHGYNVDFTWQVSDRANLDLCKETMGWIQEVTLIENLFQRLKCEAFDRGRFLSNVQRVFTILQNSALQLQSV